MFRLIPPIPEFPLPVKKPELVLNKIFIPATDRLETPTILLASTLGLLELNDASPTWLRSDSIHL